ncbi:uncharacterized protein LOC113321359 [Papaver somniferum]|uniref:uncharacterized protein LOC113321359 n=1 Tax=Papaver somniferum TaxID=3469 RepID=UPI000E6FDC41|nr:uncharacterized protein LOC113321359 [Papaver somniferum]
MQGQGSDIDAKLQKMMQGIGTMFQESQQETKSAIKDLKTQMGSMAIEINKLKAQNSGKLPSQPINPTEGVNTITLRSGTQLMQPEVTDSGKVETPKESVLEEKRDEIPQTTEICKVQNGGTRKGDFGRVKEDSCEHTPHRCYKENAKVCKGVKGLVYQ